MSQQTGTSPPTGGQDPRTQVARDEAAQLGRSTADAGGHVAGVASEQASAVAGEARRQAKDLIGEARTQATDQARAGQQRAAEGLRSLAGELHQMADGGDNRGPASDLASQAAGRADDLAGWLDRHEPGDLLGEVRAYARRRPGAFLLGAALAGVVAGRLTRGAVDAERDTGPAPVPAPRPVAPPVPGGYVPPLPGEQAAPVPGQYAPPVPGEYAPPVPGEYAPPVPGQYAPPIPAGQAPYDAPAAPPRMPAPGGPTTVGEYVRQVEESSGPPRHELRDDPRNGL